MDEHGERVSDRRAADGSSRRADGAGSSPPDLILSAVANRERRAVIESLLRTPDETVALDALANSLAETGAADGGEAGSDDRRLLRIALHHVHLPKLEESGTVDYDVEAGQVRYVGGDLERELASLLDAHDVDG